MLRNPVDRAYSHYFQKFRKGKETRSLLEVVQGEDEFVKEEWVKAKSEPEYRSRKIQGRSLLSRGRYAEQLENWFEHFPRDRFHILFSENLIQNGEKELLKIFNFLDLPSHKVDVSELKNKKDYAPMPEEAREWLVEYFREPNRRLEKLLGLSLPW